MFVISLAISTCWYRGMFVISLAISTEGSPPVRFLGMTSSVSLPCHQCSWGSHVFGISTISTTAPTIEPTMERTDAQKQTVLARAQYLLSYLSKKSELLRMMYFAFLLPPLAVATDDGGGPVLAQLPV